MTDRLKGVTIIFEKSIREDDAEEFCKHLMQLRNVAKVIPKVDNVDHRMAVELAKHDLREELWAVLYKEKK